MNDEGIACIDRLLSVWRVAENALLAGKSDPDITPSRMTLLRETAAEAANLLKEALAKRAAQHGRAVRMLTKR